MTKYRTNSDLQIANPSVPALYEDALVYETGSAITSSGALSAYSGAKTGRSPSDKRVVEEDSSKDNIWWGPVNKPMSPDVSRNMIPFHIFHKSSRWHASLCVADPMPTLRVGVGGASCTRHMLLAEPSPAPRNCGER